MRTDAREEIAGKVIDILYWRKQAAVKAKKEIEKRNSGGLNISDWKRKTSDKITKNW